MVNICHLKSLVWQARQIMPTEAGFEQVTPHRHSNDKPDLNASGYRVLCRISAFKPRSLPLIFSMLLTPGLLVRPGYAQQAAEIDWVPMEMLTEEQRAQVADFCCGLYIAPPPIPIPEGETPDNMFFSADGLVTDGDNTLSLDGNVQVQFEDKLLQGNRAAYNTETQVFTLSGGVQIRQPGMLLAGQSASIDRASGNSQISQASYVLHDEAIRGQADVILYRDEDGIITIDNGAFSRCEPGDDSWILRGASIDINQETGRGTARHVTLRVQGVPIIYTPYINFPVNNERASGFLAPVFGSTRNGGRDFSVPYYLNLAPNYDMTLTPRILSNRGVMAGVETRYMSRWSNNEVGFEYLPGDRLFDPDTASTPGGRNPPKENRWLFSYGHQGRLGRRWTSHVDYSAVSDDQYFQDISNNGLLFAAQSFLNRSGQVNYRGDNWQFSTGALSFQTIDPTVSPRNLPYDRLPRMTLDGAYQLGSFLEYGMESEYVYFYRDIDRSLFSRAELDAGARVSGQRFSVEPFISLPWSSAAAYVTPTAKYKFASYNLQDQAINTDNKPSRGVFVGSVDSGLFFERDISFAEQPLTQTLEPRIFYLYSQYADQQDIPVFDSLEMTFSFNQLFREDRFSGKDRIGDTNQVTMAMSSRLLDANGKELASGSIGQIQYLADRRVTMAGMPGQAERSASSSLAAEGIWQFHRLWRFHSYLEWSTTDDMLDVGNFQFRYQSDINHILNVSYRFRDVPNPISATGLDRRINQTDISGVWPLGGNWGLIGRWNFDHGNRRNLETIAGLEYDNCCWSVRVIARDWINNNALFFGNQDKNRAFFLQFELKGLGSVLGGNVNAILNNGITGYRDREF
jgi:LPS-assembly protein